MVDGQSSGEQLSLIKSEDYNVYTRRWLILAIFALFGMSNYFLWAQYASISDAVATYYDVSKKSVDMLSTVNLITYVVAILPVMWLTEKSNIKVVLILGACSQCVGSWIRFVGTVTHSITFNFIGQILCGMVQPCCYGMSTQLAGAWFGIDEVSLANGIGFAALELGVGLSIVVPPLVVHNGPDIEDQMNDLFLYTAIAMTLILPLTIFVFQANPPLPPSRAKMNVTNTGKQESYFLSLKVLFLNRNFLLLLAANTFNMGFLSLIAFKLNETIMLTFSKNSRTVVRYIGVTKIIGGITGAMAAGYWLDKSKSFRGTIIVTTLLTTTAVSCFTISIYLNNGLSAVVSIGIYWFLAACMIIIGFEYAVELTYPEPEIMSSGLLIASGYAFTCITMQLYDVVLDKTNVFLTMILFCVTLLIAFILTLFIGSDYRRQDADRKHYENAHLSESNTEMTNCE